MTAQHPFTRRAFLFTAAAATTVSAAPVAGDEVKDNLPIVPKRVEKLFKFPEIREPNDLQFTPEESVGSRPGRSQQGVHH